ncbi:alcohol dehydrogenase [Anaeromyxobacter sp. Fw109-5]|uniref:alcohol dehydrogenase n=1 Tax=Anaeromyxobacter sp. (strain Fw109-5) TaxID=404589 RepID=UPI00059E5300|nr:alcohol dehydrogenase [Anaeromyxobacter sp. Fw109-5]
MKVVQASRPNGPFEVASREVPDPGPGEIRVRVEACGVCHSDAVTRSGAYPGLTLPRVPGHEIAGRVDAVGANVTAWRAGDRVGVGWHGGHCFVCTACRKGDFINCVKAQITGVTLDGGYAEYAVVRYEAAARIPDGLEAAEAAPLLCAGITTYNSLRNSGARPGDTVAVQGVGGLGHLAIQYSARMGFRTVALSRGVDKRALALELGAHEYVDTQEVDAAEGLRRLGGADLVLATAPNSAAIASTVNGLKARGKLLIVAASFEPLQLSALSLLSGKTIAGWPSGSAIDSEETMAFSALGHVRPHVERFPLEQAEEAFGRVMANRVRFRAVLVP